MTERIGGITSKDMKTEKCDYCGDDLLDCDCDGTKEWYNLEDVKPAQGQMCRVKCEQLVDAYYSPKFREVWSVVKTYPKIVTTSWRPLYSERLNPEME